MHMRPSLLTVILFFNIISINFFFNFYLILFLLIFCTGSTFISQLKSTDKEFQSDTVSVQIERKTLNYLKQRLELAMIVLYVSLDNEAYWIWLKEISINWEVEQQSHLIHISKERKLSTTDWNRIEEYVTNVRMGKLEAGERFNF